MSDSTTRFRAMRLYFIISYGAFLVNTAFYFKEVAYAGPFQLAFLGSVYLTYSFLYLLPLFLSLLGWMTLVEGRLGGWLERVIRVPRAAALSVPAILGIAAAQIYFFTDRFIFHLYGFHINGFVANLVFTRGGIESMGGDALTTFTFAGIAAAFIALQAAAYLFAVHACRRDWHLQSLVRCRTIVLGLMLLVFMGLFERGVYGVSRVKLYSPVLAFANTFPYYQPISCRNLLRQLGVEIFDRPSFEMKVESFTLNYPLEPIRRAPEHPHYNIVWLAVESLRADMLDAEIMPSTHAFAERSSWFQNHYSGGNGTRMAIFSMFYGLYSPYWFRFLSEHRGPVLMDLLLEDRYQMDLFTSARFTYPEFDRTVFANVPAEHLHEAAGGKGWERDRVNVSRLLDFLDGRDPTRPFMTFLFFESPHARYYFPPENIIRKPYLEEFNYATMDETRDMPLIKNRYINSCNHLDGQIHRITSYLETHDLLKDTIVIIAGDHGEEFMEHGRWGHNSAFSPEQIRPPLVISMPGRKPEKITRMTSHLDIGVTVARALGVQNPVRDYALGLDLFGPEEREYTVLGDWNNIVYLDEGCTRVFGLGWGATADAPGGTPGEAAKVDEVEALESRKERFVEILKDLKRFAK